MAPAAFLRSPWDPEVGSSATAASWCAAFKWALAAIFASGLALVLAAQPLSTSLLFYYASGTLLGGVLIVAVLVVVLGREINRRVNTVVVPCPPTACVRARW